MWIKIHNLIIDPSIKGNLIYDKGGVLIHPEKDAKLSIHLKESKLALISSH